MKSLKYSWATRGSMKKKMMYEVEVGYYRQVLYDTFAPCLFLQRNSVNIMLYFEENYGFKES